MTGTPRALPWRPSARGAAVAAAAAVLATTALTLPLVRSGDDRAGTHRPARAAAGYAGMLAGVPLQRARCRNWHAAGSAERLQAVRALTATIGGPSTTGGVGTTLPDGGVAALFDRVCSTPQTSGFALYLIYARAAAFSRVHVARP